MRVLLLAASLAACASVDTGSDETGPGALGSANAAEVTNAHDAGPGSFRAAILEANGDPSVGSIRFREGIGRIALASAVVYTGSQPLHIDGRGGTVAGTPTCDCDLLVANGGGDLALADLAVEDAPRTGILVIVPRGATGEIEVSLRDVTIRNNGLHGFAIDDQAGDDGTGSDSDAGILIEVTSSVIAGNGFREGFSDYDGIRVDEGGTGGLGARVHGSRFVENAGDGLELDERGPGSAIADVDRSTFVDNGAQPQNPEDLEDGFDIDEADEGDIQVSIEHSTASGNHDEGLDLGEEGPGDLRLGATRFVASGNVDEGIKLLEDVETQAGGDLLVQLEYVTASGSQKGSGIQLGEVGPGDLQVEVSHSTVADNASDGVHATQAAPGEGRLQLHDVTVSGNAGEDVATEGVEVVTEGR